jgi:hypothetical protein
MRFGSYSNCEDLHGQWLVYRENNRESHGLEGFLLEPMGGGSLLEEKRRKTSKFQRLLPLALAYSAVHKNS